MILSCLSLEDRVEDREGTLWSTITGTDRLRERDCSGGGGITIISPGLGLGLPGLLVLGGGITIAWGAFGSAGGRAPGCITVIGAPPVECVGVPEGRGGIKACSGVDA